MKKKLKIRCDFCKKFIQARSWRRHRESKRHCTCVFVDRIAAHVEARGVAAA